jgi:haloalkane dehalogenase
MSVCVRGYVDTDFGQVHYRKTDTARVVPGAGALPLVLLHQTASSSSMFEPLMERIADRFVVFAPDTPGFGGTDAPREPASIALYARVLGQALDRMGIGECWLFGHHTGASIAVQLEHDRPGLARRMVISGPPYLTATQKRALAAKVQPVVLDARGDYLGALWQRLRAKDPAAPIALTHREMILNLTAGERYHEAYEAVFTHDFESQLAAITCPVLVMAGDDDSLRESLAPACAALPRGEMRVVEGAGTYVCDRAPGAVAEILREFFV